MGAMKWMEAYGDKNILSESVPEFLCLFVADSTYYTAQTIGEDSS